MHEKGLAKFYLYIKFEVSSFTRSKFTEGGLKFKKNSTLDPDFLRYFVTRKMGLARIYQYTKFEVSSFTHSRFTEGGLKFNFWSLDPNHAIFGGNLSCLRWDLPRSISTPN